jgi:hypothetical protein
VLYIYTAKLYFRVVYWTVHRTSRAAEEAFGGHCDQAGFSCSGLKGHGSPTSFTWTLFKPARVTCTGGFLVVSPWKHMVCFEHAHPFLTPILSLLPSLSNGIGGFPYAVFYMDSFYYWSITPYSKLSRSTPSKTDICHFSFPVGF